MIATALLAALLAAPNPRASAPNSTEQPADRPEVPAAPAPLSDDEVRERVEGYLGAIDRPIRAEAWRALGPAAVPHLEATIRSEELPTRRAAAVAGLAAIGGDQARELVLELARRDDVPFVVRSAALRSARQVASGAELVDAIGPVLRDARSAQVRAVAADALASAGPDGCGAVRAQARREGSGGRTRYSRALARCGPR